jgi:hypothetical protein
MRLASPLEPIMRMSRALGLLLVLGCLAPWVASGQSTHETAVSLGLSAPGARAAVPSAATVQAYWTDARMNAATPMPVPRVVRRARSAAPQSLVAPSGPTVIATSGRHDEHPHEERTLQAPGDADIAPLAAGGSAFTYTRYRLFPNTQSKTYPYKAVGQLFFTIPGQGDFVCSGSVVNSANSSMVWTAGHCVYTPGVGAHTNFLFAPGRSGGVNPFGTWTVKEGFTTLGWQIGLFEFDHGALVMNLGGNTAVPKKIGQRTGFLGFAANVPRQQNWHIHGYPLAPRALTYTPPGAQFDGEHQEICGATWAADDVPTGLGPPTVGIGCDQTGGTSGGPWMIDFSGLSGSTNLLNGNNSYRYVCPPCPPNDLEIYSPYFSDAASNVRDAAQAVPVP